MDSQNEMLTFAAADPMAMEVLDVARLLGH